MTILHGSNSVSVPDSIRSVDPDSIRSVDPDSIRPVDPDPDPGGQKRPRKVEKN